MPPVVPSSHPPVPSPAADPSSSPFGGGGDDGGGGAGPAQPEAAARPLFFAGLLASGFVALGLVLAGFGFYVTRKNADRCVPGLSVEGQAIGGEPLATLPATLHRIADQALGRKLRLLVGRDRVTASLRELGVSVDEAALTSELKSLGHSGDPAQDLQAYLHGKRHGYRLSLPFTLEDKRALDYLIELKDTVDRAPVDARLDLEKHTIAPDRPGYLLRVYDSLVSLEYATRSLRAGTPLAEVRLAVAETPPQVVRKDLEGLDVSTVLGTWETHYSNAAIDSDRTYNLKVGAGKLDGHIIKPHETFSFNGAVGDRTEKEGYRVAPVISGGELIDGLAGGMCQIASTLHAASFFAGLDIVRTTPHSRPSTYIPMGLDSTVVWPSVDLKLKNPYDFPIVIHYVVNQGSVKVELLGKQPPSRVAFEREILVETPFPTVTRNDPEMPTGQKFVDQEGYPGYKLKRRRYVFTGKWKLDPKNENRPKPETLIAKKEWDISYPATAHIVRVGTGPANLPKKTPPPLHKIAPLPAWAKPIFYIVK